jgi:hypothetical protein
VASRSRERFESIAARENHNIIWPPKNLEGNVRTRMAFRNANCAISYFPVTPLAGPDVMLGGASVRARLSTPRLGIRGSIISAKFAHNATLFSFVCLACRGRIRCSISPRIVARHPGFTARYGSQIVCGQECFPVLNARSRQLKRVFRSGRCR